MEAGTRVWYHQNEDWLLATVVDKTDDTVLLQSASNPEISFSAVSEDDDGETEEKRYKGVELANEATLNESNLSNSSDDLTHLPYLNEPSIVHEIATRFHEDKIYTWTGSILIAVNPFQRLPLYTDSVLESFQTGSTTRGGNDSRPHVFAVASRAYLQMMGEDRPSQSILISGESGSGKTESTKYVLKYLTTVNNGELSPPNEVSIMGRVMQSNPILEAFGNARTLRNDNSSRFGKYINLGFDARGRLQGAKIETYLLEKVRVTFHAKGERNYHIFYQFLQGCSQEQQEAYGLRSSGDDLTKNFRYTGMGGAPSLKHFSDEYGLRETLLAMKEIGWSKTEIQSVLSAIAGLLHLGQIDFTASEDSNGIEKSSISSEDTLKLSASLLGVDANNLQTALTTRVLAAGANKITKPLSAAKATDARDALAKTIYSSLFHWIIHRVNASICWEADGQILSSCGVLDIFGFERFVVNSFEQLCINFANEALQEQFNRHVFKTERAMYEDEGLKWNVSFPDNQDCLDLIQASKTGILAMLDDELRMPRGSDRNWAKRMYNKLSTTDSMLKNNAAFSATPCEQAKGVFCIRHFAGEVKYSAETGFMEKNKDEIPWTTQTLFETAGSRFLTEILETQQKHRACCRAETSRSSAAKNKTTTVGGHFKAQLQSLIHNIEETGLHYIRCLKPNDFGEPQQVDCMRLSEQLRYGGVIGAVHVARNSFPIRLDHETFFRRYRRIFPTLPVEQLPWVLGNNNRQQCEFLLSILTRNPSIASNSTRKMAKQALKQKPLLEDDVKVGLSKVFMNHKSHSAIEAQRSMRNIHSATIIQTWIRAYQQRHLLVEFREATVVVQRIYRGYKGKAHFRLSKHAAIELQRTFSL